MEPPDCYCQSLFYYRNAPKLTNGNHVQMALLHRTIKLDKTDTITAHLKRLEVQAISRSEVVIASCSRISSLANKRSGLLGMSSFRVAVRGVGRDATWGIDNGIVLLCNGRHC